MPTLVSVPEAPSSIQQVPQAQPSCSHTARTSNGAASLRWADRASASVTPCSIASRWALRERRRGTLSARARS
jgi:hypothetical protein